MTYPGSVARRLLVLVWIVALNSLGLSAVDGQSAKEINQQAQFWWSINSTSRITDRFGIVGDVHIRRNHFLEDPSFYFLRFGTHFWLTERFTLTIGYAHLWKAPSSDDLHTWTDEDRIYQQVQYSSKIGSVSMLQRFRNEQRWQEQTVNDELLPDRSFSNRMRYLMSFTIPVSQKPTIPSLVLSDEILIQFGSGITTNTFDQNRFFAGIKKKLSPSWSCDFGYMPVYQEKSNGYQYDLNHTIRWFFYYTPDFRHGMHPTHEPASQDE